MPTDGIQPLPADKARQAAPSIRGIEYQIWQTVAAWLDLDHEQLLYVEGAEDFDVVGPDAAATVQVKASSSEVSLGRAYVLDAINNFWTLREKLPHGNLKFRFLTRASIGFERGHPFGKDLPGLELWKRPRMADEEVRQICDFLVAQERLAPKLRSWLSCADVSDIRCQLIDRIAFETSSEAVEFVERSVERKLLAFAERREETVPVSTISRVAWALFREVMRVLRKEGDRSVGRFEFVEVWDAETRVSLRQTEVDRFLRGGLSKSAPAGSGEEFGFGVPALPANVAKRADLTEKIRRELDRTGLFNLHGSTRMGKSTLAKLMIGDEGDRWIWWAASRKDPLQAPHSFRNLVRHVATHPQATALVLDDFQFSPDEAHRVEDVLSELVAMIRGRRGRILIIGHKALSPRLQHAFSMDAESVLAVPRLSREEVTQIAADLGCPRDGRLASWSNLVFLRTTGHPQLVAAHLLPLRQAGWPHFSGKGFFTGVSEIYAEKAEARQLLQTLPDSQRLILHRASVFPYVFTRTHAIGMSAVPPALLFPGDLFDPLVGPWIEPLKAGYFGLSPLIDGCAREIYPEDQVRAWQNAAAEVLMSSDAKTTLDGAMAFRLVWEARNFGALIQFVLGFNHMHDDVFASFSSNLVWFVVQAASPGEMLVPGQPTISLILRVFQFRVAHALNSSLAANVVRSWWQELENAPAADALVGWSMLATQALPHCELPFSWSEVVQLFARVDDAVKAHPNLQLTLPAERGSDVARYLPENEWVSCLAFFQSQRIIDVDSLDDFLDALESADGELRSRILRGVGACDFLLRLAIDRVWLRESERENPDWDRCLCVFERAFNCGGTWGLVSLQLAAVRGTSTVLDEYVGEHQGARDAIDRMAGSAVLVSYLLDDRRAATFFSEERFEEAERWWRRALESWPASEFPFDHSAAQAARSAGMAAARQGRWEAAAEWFLEIPRRLAEPRDPHLAAGGFADAGFAFWNAGKGVECVGALVSAWEHADSLPRGKEDLRAFQTRKLAGHVISWIHDGVTNMGRGNLSEPRPGICSSLEQRPFFKELPEGEPHLVWLFLIRIERELGAGDRARNSAPTIEASASPQVRSLAAMETVSSSIASGEVSNLPRQVIEMAHAMRAVAELYPEKFAKVREEFEPEAFHRDRSPIFLAALISTAANGRGWQDAVSAWRASVHGLARESEWNAWFHDIEKVLGLPAQEAGKLIQRGSVPWQIRMLAAARVLISEDAGPECFFQAHASWLIETTMVPFLRDSGTSFCQLVETAWLRMIESPFRLRQPQSTVPAIRAACQMHGTPLLKARHILYAAEPAVSSSVASSVRAKLDADLGTD